MSAVPIVTKAGPRTYTPDEPILGGQLVEARTGGKIGVAAAGSVKVLGVALTDGQDPDAVVLNGQPLNAAITPTKIGVAYGGMEVPVTYSANAAFGDKLVATATGKVAPAGATPDARTIVGICAEPAGVTVASNAVGLMRTA
ncbi:hypothetical protein [Nocardia sp. NPDC057455]|uniref:hypothetical protein n=1 Tax=Nocardia sp. NPDC057455 TaxID=3346138 RepID=UPI00366C6B25